MEEKNASSFHLTSTNAWIDNSVSKNSSSLDWVSAEGDTLTDREITEVEHLSNAHLPTPPFGNELTDPVFGYRIHSDLSQICGKDVFDVSELGSIKKFISSHIEWGLEPGSFLVTNLSILVSQ